MELVLVRHAEPGRPDDPAESVDPGLSDDGQNQADAVANRFARQNWDALYTSPDRRSRETAAAISRTVGLAPTVVDGLADVPTGGTDAATGRERVVATVEDIIEAHPGERVVLVSHGTVVNAYIGGFLKSRELIFHDSAHTGVSHVMASRHGHREILRLNDSTHLRLPWPASPPKELR